MSDTLVRIHLVSSAPGTEADDPLDAAEPAASLTSVVTHTRGPRLDVTLTGTVDGAIGEELQVVLAQAREHGRRTRGTVSVDTRRARAVDGTLHRFLARLEGVTTAAGARLETVPAR